MSHTPENTFRNRESSASCRSYGERSLCNDSLGVCHDTHVLAAKQAVSPVCIGDYLRLVSLLPLLQISALPAHSNPADSIRIRRRWEFLRRAEAVCDLRNSYPWFRPPFPKPPFMPPFMPPIMPPRPPIIWLGMEST